MFLFFQTIEVVFALNMLRGHSSSARVAAYRVLCRVKIAFNHQDRVLKPPLPELQHTYRVLSRVKIALKQQQRVLIHPLPVLQRIQSPLQSKNSTKPNHRVLIPPLPELQHTDSSAVYNKIACKKIYFTSLKQQHLFLQWHYLG